jgi:hypothetical protein
VSIDLMTAVPPPGKPAARQDSIRNYEFFCLVVVRLG